MKQRSREIVDIFADVVAETAKDCTIMQTFPDGKEQTIACPAVHYIFGNGQYVKDHLDELSKAVNGNASKFPLIALFLPVKESRNNPDYHSTAKVSLLIACSSDRRWSNEQREVYSFRNILRPIYESLKKALAEDGRLDLGYEDIIPHEYSENYTYGKYGAMTSAGDEVSEPIDAINITNLEIKIIKLNCRQQ